MITVAGEALIDIVTDQGGTLVPLPGGAPFNVARFVARLGADCTFLGRLSDDRFGAWLRDELLSAGVLLATPGPVAAPTTIAIAQLDAHGSADYRFYVEGTSAAGVRPQDLPEGLLHGGRALAIGGLGLVFEPTSSTLLELVARAPSELLVVLDPNCRPRSLPDVERYRETISSLLERVHVLKVSVDDVAVLSPGSDPVEYAALAVGAGPAMVVVTDGPRPVTLMTAAGIRSLPVPRVDVVDTIGAGDGFVAGLLCWFAAHPEVDPRTAALDALEPAANAAAEVAAAVCTARGASLPAGFSWRGGAPARAG